MAAVSTGDAVRVDLVADIDADQDMIGVYQFRLISGDIASEADVLDDLLSIGGAIVTIVRQLCNVLTVWRKIRAVNLTTNTLIGEADFTPNVAGSLTGDQVPYGVAALTTFPTYTPNVRLRKFLGGLDSGVLTASGKITAGGVADLADFVTLMLDPFTETNGTWQYGYLSPKTAGWVGPVSGTVTNVPAYQRRRRQGTGS